MKENQLAATQSLVEVIEGRAQTLNASFFWSLLTKDALFVHSTMEKRLRIGLKIGDLSKNIRIKTSEAYGDWSLVSCLGTRNVKRKGTNTIEPREYPLCWFNPKLKSVIYRRDAESLAYHLIYHIFGFPQEMRNQVNPLFLFQSPLLSGYSVDEPDEPLPFDILTSVEDAASFNLQSKKRLKTQNKTQPESAWPKLNPGKGDSVYIAIQWVKGPDGPLVSGLSAIATNSKGRIEDEFNQQCHPEWETNAESSTALHEGERLTMKELLVKFCEWTKTHQGKVFYTENKQYQLRQWFIFYGLQGPVIRNLYAILKHRWPKPSCDYLKSQPKLEVVIRCYGVSPYSKDENQFHARNLQLLHRCSITCQCPIYTPKKVMKFKETSTSYVRYLA